MNLKNLFTLNAILGVLFGLALVLVPKPFFEAYGVEVSDGFANTGQLLGAAYIGFAVLAWGLRSESASPARAAVVLGYFVSYVIGFIVSLIGQLQGIGNALGWSTVVIMLILLLGFGYFQFLGKED